MKASLMGTVAAVAPFRVFGRRAAVLPKTAAPVAAAPKADDDDGEEMRAGQEGPNEDPKPNAAGKDDLDGDDDMPDDDDEEGDDDSDRDEMSGKKGKRAQSARTRERHRIAAILEAGRAHGNMEFAAYIALTMPLTRSQAVDLLARSPAESQHSLHRRMAADGRVHPGAGAAPQAQNSQALWEAAFKRAQGRRAS